MSDFYAFGRCAICGGMMAWDHQHLPDQTGLDDGPPLGRQYRKPPPKSAAETREIQARRWATRRAKYGERGHR